MEQSPYEPSSELESQDYSRVRTKIRTEHGSSAKGFKQQMDSKGLGSSDLKSARNRQEAIDKLLRKHKSHILTSEDSKNFDDLYNRYRFAGLFSQCIFAYACIRLLTMQGMNLVSKRFMFFRLLCA